MFTAHTRLTYYSPSQRDLRFITPDTLTDLMAGRFEDRFDEVKIIDCRFPYEYVGGHIQGENIFIYIYYTHTHSHLHLHTHT